MSVLGRVAGKTTVEFNRVVAGALMGGLAGGVIGGVGARISMRMVAILSDSTPGFSLSGTLGILFIGALFGSIFGLVYSLIRDYLPGRGAGKGLVFGLILCLIFVVLPFWFASQGELTLISPLTGMLLFGPIPFAYGAALGILEKRAEERLTSRESASVGIIWLALFVALLVVTLIGCFSLADAQLIFPSLFVLAYKTLGLSFSTARSLHALLILGFTVAYCGMAAALLWFRTGSRMARFATLVLLAFSAAFFNDGEIFQPAMDSLWIIRWLPGLLQSIGLIGLLFLFFWFPDGRFFPSWTRPASILLSGLVLVIFAGFSSNEALVELQPLIGAVILSCGLLALGARYRASQNLIRRAQIYPFMLSSAILLLYFVLLAVGTALIPAVRAWQSQGLESLFSFGPYLFPWLLLPAALLSSIRRFDLWGGE